MTITFDFEEIPLVIGKDPKTGKQLRLALITGSALINVVGSDRSDWEFDGSITLSGPILHDPDVTVRWCRETDPRRQLWDWVTHSIELACTEDIQDAIAEARAGDPDARRDGMIDDSATAA